MSIITKIDGVPLFHTFGRALAWGEKFGLTDYHTHEYKGTIGYMAGSSHENAIKAISAEAVSTSDIILGSAVYTPPPPRPPSPRGAPPPPTVSRGGTSGGGTSGGGY
jgi:hypothetical protein